MRKAKDAKEVCNVLCRVIVLYVMSCSEKLQTLSVTEGLLVSCSTLVSFVAYISTMNIQRVVLPKRRLTSNGLHSITFQEIELFISMAEGTSVPS
jgi:hypothetical protein